MALVLILNQGNNLSLIYTDLCGDSTLTTSQISWNPMGPIKAPPRSHIPPISFLPSASHTPKREAKGMWSMIGLLACRGEVAFGASVVVC